MLIIKASKLMWFLSLRQEMRQPPYASPNIKVVRSRQPDYQCLLSIHHVMEEKIPSEEQILGKEAAVS